MPINKISFLTKSSGMSAIERLRIIDPAFFAELSLTQIDPSGVEDLEGSQIVTFQREFPYESTSYAFLVDYCAKNSIQSVYEIDDYLHGLPITHPDRVSGVMGQRLLSMYLAIQASSLVTVSTETLKKQYEHLNSNIRVLPNYFDDRLFGFKTPQKTLENNGPVKILYMGGRSHLLDVELIIPVLKTLLEEFGETIHLHMLGIPIPKALKPFRNISADTAIRYDYEEFAKHLQHQIADIAIAPLEDNLFNRCKSPIKHFEYASLGIPGVFSRVQPYMEVIQHGRNGFLATNYDEWYEKLKLLIKEPALRYDIASQAQEEISDKYLLSKNAWRWRETYEEALRLPPHRQSNVLMSQLQEITLQSRESFQYLEQRASETQIQLMELETEISSLAQELSTIKGSKAWKTAMFLRKTRVKLLPNKSFLFKGLRKVYLWLNRPVWKSSSRNRFKTKFTLKNQPLVSVIIPIYDRTDLLRQSIDSILNQSHQNIEVLLICDGSPQDTLDIVDEYAKKFPEKVRVFKFKLNSGNAVKARNKGIKEARGEYIAFQDTDDIAEPRRIEYSLETLEKFNADVVYGAWRALIDGSRNLDIRNGEIFISPDCDLEMLKKICVPCQSTVMAKTETLRAVGGLNTKMGYREDHELWLRLAYAGHVFKADSRVFTNLRLHEGNLEIALKGDDQNWEKLMLAEYKKPRSLMPKIGYLIPGTGISGGVSVICEQSNRLIERGYDVSLISQDNKTSIKWFPSVLAEIFPLSLIDENYDILIATGWSTANPVLEYPAKRKLYLVQSDESRFFDPGDPEVAKVRQTYLGNFEFLTIATWLQNWLKTSFQKQATLVKNGINENYFHKTSPLVPKSGKLRVLLEGPIAIPFKGLKDAFAVIEDLDCEVWCVSSAGKPESSWRVDRFFYQVPLLKMKEIYSSCDVILKMSRVESFCYPPLEMMACGGTAVIGQVTGIEEYARDGYNCLIVEQGDIEGARAALQKLIDDKKLLNELKANGLLTAQSWSWDSSIDVLEAVINR